MWSRRRRCFFDPLVSQIVGHVHGLMRESAVKFIYLVGGFGESAYLQQAVKRAFENEQCRVIVPVRPGLAVRSMPSLRHSEERLRITETSPCCSQVVRGAVIFGMNTSVFASRKASTILSLIPHNSGVHHH